MGFNLTSNQIQDQISHKAEILRLIRKTNDKIADFNETPTLVDVYTKQTNYTVQAQRGKEIALAVQVVLINSRTILPLKFFQDLRTDNKFKKAFQRPYKFLAEDATTQYDGIVQIVEFYQALLDALYSLPDFSDVLMINTKKQKRRMELNQDDEDEIFDL